MAGKGQKPGSGGFDPSENVNSNTLKRHPKMDLSRNDLLQLLSYLEGELQARDVAIATLKAEKAKQLLYQAKYGRFGLGDPFTAMQRDSDNMKDNSFDESAIKCMYDNQLAQLENLIATQRKAQMKMREQMITSDKKYQKVCSELDDEKKKHAQDTAQGDDVTYMLEKERERLKQEIEFEKSNVRKMEKDLKKTLVSLEEERASSGKHKQVALMLIKERKSLVEKYMIEKRNAEDAERLLLEERTKAMNMAEGLVQESKKSLKMEATMERQLSEFDLEREQMRNKLLREENRNRDLQSQVELLRQQLDTLQKQMGKSPKDSYHSVEIKSQISSPQVRLSSERTQGWSSPGSTALNMSSSPSNDINVIEREAGLSPRNNSPSDVSVRKRDTRYASPQPHNIERSGGGVQHHNSSQLETRVAPVGASDRNASDPQQTLNKLNIQLTGGHHHHHHQGGQTVTTSAGSGHITVQTGTGSPTPGSGPVSPRRVLAIGRGVPPPIPPNKPVLSVTSANTKPVTQKLITNSPSAKENRVTTSTSKPVHIPVSVVHTSSVTTAANSRAGKQREGSPSSIRKPAQLSASLPLPATTVPMEASSILSNSDSFDFLGPEMADLQQLLVSMVTVSPDSTGVETTATAISASISTSLLSSTTASSIPSVSSPSLSASFSSSTISGNSQVIHSSTPENSKPSISDSYSSQPRSSLLSPSSYTVSVVASAQFSTLSATPVMSSPSSTPSPSSSITSLSPLSTFPSSSSFVSPPVLFNTSPPMSMSPSSVSSPNSVTALPTSPIANYSAEERSSFSLRHERGHLRTDKGLLPPTASQNAMDAWTLHQLGNRDLPHSPIHRYASCGDKDLLRKLIVDLDADVNLPMKDGTTPCHCAAENGQEDCLKLLISRGGNINCLRDDQLTPVHCAAAQGHSQCLELLLTHGGLSHIADQSMWTPLHWSAANGHVECCKQLLKRGAKRTAVSNTNWTPCHMAVHAGHVDCLDLLLTFESDKSDKLNAIKPEINRVKDRDGWSLAHLAASKDSSDCLSVILAHCDIDVYCRDKLGRSVMDVGSASVRQILMPYVSEEQVMQVTVEMTCTGLSYHQQQPYIIGSVGITSGMSWLDVYRVVSDLCEVYFEQIDRGLHSKKISRLDPDGTTEGGHASLGLNKDSICSLDIGTTSFNLDSTNMPDIMPYKCLLDNNIDCISVKLKGFEGAYSSFAFDLLMPVSTISNYIRLLEQYHSVIFYGPEGTRKKRLVKRLSHHIANKEYTLGEVRVIPVYVHRDYSNRDFIQLLKDNGCMIPTDCVPNTLCILMLFHLEKVNFTQMFGSLLQHMDSRGRQHTFYMTDADNIQESFYLSDHFYLIATMDKPRSIGLDLSTQQRFRWVNFCVNVEPIRNLLARHLLQRLIHAYGGHAPTLDDPLFKAVEWLVCVWQRLNDGANKLGLPDVVFGPEIFLPCPLESKQAQGIFDWMKKLWNETISSAVKAAIQKGKENRGDNAGKVTSTALYVLLQRVIVPGCPLAGKEKEDYLKQFQGSNELDIPLNKADKSPNISVAGFSQRRPLYDSKRPVDDDISSSKTKHRNSIDGDGRFLFTHTVTANTPKRRSLSETHLGQTEQIEIPIMHQQRESSKSQSKVPKLEIRSPVLGLTVPLPSNLHQTDNIGTSMLSSLGNSYDIPTRRSTFSSHSRIPQAISKRSRSTEAAQRAQMQGISSPFRPPKSPFSFSLTTPTSSLFSFKFLDNNNKDEVSRQPVFTSSRESQC